MTLHDDERSCAGKKRRCCCETRSRRSKRSLSRRARVRPRAAPANTAEGAARRLTMRATSPTVHGDIRARGDAARFDANQSRREVQLRMALGVAQASKSARHLWPRPAPVSARYLRVSRDDLASGGAGCAVSTATKSRRTALFLRNPRLREALQTAGNGALAEGPPPGSYMAAPRNQARQPRPLPTLGRAHAGQGRAMGACDDERRLAELDGLDDASVIPLVDLSREKCPRPGCRVPPVQCREGRVAKSDDWRPSWS